MYSKIFSGTLSAGVAWAILAGSGLGLLPVVASASNPSDEVPTITVHYQDLNLSTEAGASALYRRISGAAFAVCGSVETIDLQIARMAKACEDRAISRAVTTINMPLLTRVYLDKSGHNRAGSNEVAER